MGLFVLASDRFAVKDAPMKPGPYMKEYQFGRGGDVLDRLPKDANEAHFQSRSEYIRKKIKLNLTFLGRYSARRGCEYRFGLAPGR